MKNKKGFTLIELLAVIVILAIIALIATPIILNMINEARKSAAKDTALGYIEAIEYNSGLGDIGTAGYEKIEDGTYQVSDIDIKLKGKKPASGVVEVEKNKVQEATLCVEGYSVYYDGKEADIKGKCDKNETKILYKETILNGATPQLKSDMVPVTIANDGTVKKADIYSKWYTYKNKKWANAVVLTDSTSYNAGDTIPENKIKAYYVWIPRYKYQLFNSTSPIEIQITFESKTTQKSTTTTVGEYLTHPAFTYGSEELNGFWTGKFETTTSSTIKPNTTSQRSQNASTQYATSLTISTGSRMMKNDEWGAVAYLTQSKYGKNSEVRLNNNTTFKTGCGASAENGSRTSACQIAYGGATSYPQSTTGNINGIFDMSGGSWEYMMAVRADSSGNPLSGKNNLHNSGFNGKFGDPGSDSSDSSITELTNGTNFPASKNYNLYDNPSNRNSITGDNGCNGSKCYGHALTETKNWNGDFYSFPKSSEPLLIRGGASSDGANAGLFTADDNYGLASLYDTFRVVVP